MAQGDLVEVKHIMIENIEKVLERGEKLDLLVDKTDNLQVVLNCLPVSWLLVQGVEERRHSLHHSFPRSLTDTGRAAACVIAYFYHVALPGDSIYFQKRSKAIAAEVVVEGEKKFKACLSLQVLLRIFCY